MFLRIWHCALGYLCKGESAAFALHSSSIGLIGQVFPNV